MTAERTAESTVPSPGAQPRDHGFPTVPVVPTPGRGGAGFPFPVRRPAARPASPVPLLGADLGAALLGALTLSRPLLMGLLVAGAMLVRPHGRFTPAPGAGQDTGREREDGHDTRPDA
ncbi:hypothetical protein AB0O67_20305, partial [Streptomyces sp. NPDC086077]